MSSSASASEPPAPAQSAYAEAAALLQRGQHVAARQLLLPLWLAFSAGDEPGQAPAHFRVDVGSALAHCAMLAGDCEQALAVIDTCLRMPVSPAQEARLLWIASTAHMFLGHYAEALSLGRAAGENEQADPATRINAFAYVAAMYSETGQHGQASACLQSAQALLTRFPDPGLFSLVQAVHAKFELEHYDPLQALRYTERALAAAEQSPVALNRTILYWSHARALGALGRWQEALDWLGKIDPATINYWEEIRVEAVRVNAYVNLGQRQKALQRLDTVLARRNPAYAAQEYTALMDLLDAGELAGAPAIATLLDDVERQAPDAFVVTHARVAWIKARHAFRHGLPYTADLARFVRLCEQHRLPALLGHAAAQMPGLFLDGIAAGISSPLYPAVLPELMTEQLEPLAALVADRNREPSLRANVFQVLVRQPYAEPTIKAAQAVLRSGPPPDQPDLGQAARRLLSGLPSASREGRTATFRLSTFGTFALLHGTERVGDQLRARARDLFVMLMLSGSDPLYRSYVQETFWPHLRPQAAANNLRVVVHNLRHVLACAQPDGSPPVELHAHPDGSLQLSGHEHVVWDVRELQAHVTVGQRCAAAGQFDEAMAAYSQAIAIYRGPFMADAACDAAFSTERGFYARLVQEARLDLAALYLDHGDPAEALLLAERATEADPLDEMAHQLVMRAHAALGYPHRVTAAYARYERIIADEIGGEPPAAIVQLYKRLLGQTGQTAG